MRIVIELKRGARAADRAQPALQAHPDAGKLQHDLPGRGQRTAEGDGAGAGDPALHRSPHRRGAPAHRVPAEKARTASTSWKATSCARPHRPCDRDHPRQPEPRRGARKPGGATSAARRSSSTSLAGCRRRFADKSPFSAKQADAILDLQLHRLTRLSIDEDSERAERNPRAHSPSTKRSSARRRSCAR